MRIAHKTALTITIIGALNWDVSGIFRFEVVAQMAGGSTEPLARFNYLLLGISGLINLGLLFDDYQRNRNDIQMDTPKKFKRHLPYTTGDAFNHY